MVLNYQARLTGSTGVPLPDGARNVRFSVWSAVSGGTCLWYARGTDCSTNIGAKSVTMASGSFSTLLGESGDNALMHAVLHGNFEMTRALLDAGADPDLKGQGFTPLGMAALRGNTRIVQALLKAGADVILMAPRAKPLRTMPRTMTMKKGGQRQ